MQKRIGRIVGTALAVAILAALGAATGWQLWEQDVFWQSRAGGEILAGQGIQTIDTWSLTANGRPWLNTQWLATVLIHLVHAGYGITGLIGLRIVGGLATIGACLLLLVRQRSVDWVTATINQKR